MNDDHVVSLAQLKEFAKLGKGARFKSTSSKVETYTWIGTTLSKFRYSSLRKKEKSIVKTYVITMTGYSEGMIDKLIRKKNEVGILLPQKRTQHSFEKWYSSDDIVLLAEVASSSLHQNGRALKAMCKSMYDDFADVRFERLAHISVSHLYNLKKTRVYRSKAMHYVKTNPVVRNIGERRKPTPRGIPGYIRIDSVHQGDLDKEKGVYHVNAVDEVTQGEHIGCVEGISEYFLLPLLEELLNAFPFKVLGFHSDNGSEYINHQVARMLQKMMVDQTKSRSRHSNDNALVEGKNGAVVRKYLGHAHIPKKHAEKINVFYRDFLNPYLNHHRFCGFATDYVNAKGKIKKKYETYLTPIQKLLSLTECAQYLKGEVTRESLETETKQKSHLAAAHGVVDARRQLFKEINKKI